MLFFRLSELDFLCSAVACKCFALPCRCLSAQRTAIPWRVFGKHCCRVASLCYSAACRDCASPRCALAGRFGAIPLPVRALQFHCGSRDGFAVAEQHTDRHRLALPLLRKDVLCLGNARIAVPSLASSVRNSAAPAHLRRTYASPWYALPLLCRAQHRLCPAEQCIAGLCRCPAQSCRALAMKSVVSLCLSGSFPSWSVAERGVAMPSPCFVKLSHRS